MDVLGLGLGHSKKRHIRDENQSESFEDANLTTIDMDPGSSPDILMDLDVITRGEKLPFPDESFDEIHAYNFLEHIGRQGDWRGLFIEFGEYHRLLKDGGEMYILVPLHEDSIADPGHTRFFHQNYFGFLNQGYNKDSTNGGTDYSWFWKKNFDIHFMQVTDKHHLAVILRKS